MKRIFIAGAALLFASLASSRAAVAATCQPGCSELPALEKEIFEQEFLQAQFQKYAVGFQIVPTPERSETMIEAMQREAAQSLNGYSASDAGGGKKGNAKPAAGTESDCSIVVILPNGKKAPYNAADYAKTHRCWEDAFVAHEQQHVADCKANKDMFTEYEAYAASDVRAYGVGIRRLREYAHETAERCGVEGSSEASKPNPVDKKPEPTIPTPDQVKSKLSALKSNRTRPPKASASKGGTK